MSALHSVCSVFFFLEPFGRPRFRFNGFTVNQQRSIRYPDNSAVFSYSKLGQEINKCTLEITIFLMWFKLKIQMLIPCAERILNLKTKN